MTRGNVPRQNSLNWKLFQIELYSQRGVNKRREVIASLPKGITAVLFLKVKKLDTARFALRLCHFVVSLLTTLGAAAASSNDDNDYYHYHNDYSKDNELLPGF